MIKYNRKVLVYSGDGTPLVMNSQCRLLTLFQLIPFVTSSALSVGLLNLGSPLSRVGDLGCTSVPACRRTKSFLKLEDLESTTKKDLRILL